MSYPAASVPKVSTRILLSAFIAVFFALLLMLPASGQGNFDRTDGRISSGALSVGVFDNIQDAQLEKNILAIYINDANERTEVYLPLENPGSYVGTQGSHFEGDTAYLANPLASPQQTFFGETLWVSNNRVNDFDDPDTTGVNESLSEGAYNTILITAERDSVTLPADSTCAIATVRNPRANDSITVWMAETAATDGATYYQAFVRVLDPTEENDDGTLVHEESDDGPACTAYDPGAGVLHANTASILARHGDRITIDVAGAGEVSLDVDGEGPDLLDITPEDLSYVRSNSHDFSFIVRDNDSGLRHDGELVVTADGDYTELNGDGDHVTSGEPLSLPSGGQIRVNGEAAEIDVKAWDIHGDFSTADDMTGAGRWTLLGNRPGVAYSFVAESTDLDEGTYYMEVSAFDRVGNEAVSDALDGEEADPTRYIFTVDDTDPATVEAWAGIAYEMNDLGGLEIADRSWIMVEFNEPVRQGIDPERIRVAGHEVLSVFQPQEAPNFRELLLEDVSPGTLPDAQRLTIAPPAPRAATSLAPQAQTPDGEEEEEEEDCDSPVNTPAAIEGFRFVYDRITGDAKVTWNRHLNDCEGYRVGMVLGGTPVAVVDLKKGSSEFLIPRASGLGRVIEAALGSSADLYMRIEVQPAAVDVFGGRLVDTTVDLGSYTAAPGSVSGDTIAPFVLHPNPPPDPLPESDDLVECKFTEDGARFVRLAWTHSSASPPAGWTHVLYYQQLTYPGSSGKQGDHFDLFEPRAAGTENGSVYGGYFGLAGYKATATVAEIYENSLGVRVASILTTGTCEEVPDTMAPTLESAKVAGPTLTLMFSEVLDPDHKPATGAFTVSVDGSSVSVTNVDMDEDVVTLTLGQAVTEGSVQYTPPETPNEDDRLQDYFENEVATFTRTVTNDAPVALSPTVNGSTLTIPFTKSLDAAHKPPTNEFSVSGGSQSRTVTNVAISQLTVTLTVSPPVTHDETGITVSYTPPDTESDRLQDGVANQVIDFTRSVLNRTADTDKPKLVSEAVNGATLTLTYDEDLDTTSTPDKDDDFDVQVQGQPRTVTNVEVNGRQVTLTLASAVTQGQSVLLTYTVPSTNPIQDDAPNPNIAEGFTKIVSKDTRAPMFSNAEVVGDTLTLTYDEDLKDLQTTSESDRYAFTVSGTVPGATTFYEVTAVDVTGVKVVLTIDSPVVWGETVRVGYTKPGSGPVIEDLVGNDAGRITNKSVTNNTPPKLKSAVANGATLTLTYDGDLDGDHVPPSGYQVSGGHPYTLWIARLLGHYNPTDVSVNGRQVTLTFDPPVEHGDVVTLSYVLQKDSRDVQDAAGNKAAEFDERKVTNQTPDTTLPALVEMPVVNGTTLTLTYSEALDEILVPAPSAYTVMGTKSGSHPATGVDVIGDTVTLTLSPPAVHKEDVTLTYVAGTDPVRDLAENDAMNLLNEPVRNDTPDTDPPVFDFATVSGATLTLVYNEPLNSDSAPAKTAFSVTGEVDSSITSHSVTGVNVAGATVELTLSPAVAFGEKDVTVSYTNPGTNPIEDLAGNDADDLDKDVTNDTPDPDHDAPVLGSAAVNGAALTLTYNEGLDSASVPVPDGGAYTVKVNGSIVTIDDISVTGMVVSLTLALAVVHGDEVTIAYVPKSNPVRDDSQNMNNAPNVPTRGVANDTADTRAPELAGASVNRATLFLTFDKVLGSSKPADPNAFTVTVNDVAVENGVSSISSVSGTQVTLVLATAVERVDVVKISYTKPENAPFIVDDVTPDPNAAESFDPYLVNNNTPWDSRPLRLGSAFVNGNKLTLTYEKALDTGSVPGTGAYTVTVNEVTKEHAVGGVLVSTVSVVLTLRGAVQPGDKVTLDYTPPTSSPVQDLVGILAGMLDDESVDNITQAGSNNPGIRNEREPLSREDALKLQGYWPEDINGEVIEDTRTRIYIELARELEADETPEVVIFAGIVHDLAGNTNESEEITPRDGIAPRFTVTVTATAQDRPIANARGEFTVDVRADEDLRRRPVVYFTDIDAVKDADDGYDYSIGDGLQTGATLTVQADAQHWQRTYVASGLNAFDGLFGLVVYGFDYEENVGESGGWERPKHRRTSEMGPPKTGNGLDLTQMEEAGVLLELDREFNGGGAPEHAVAPSRRMRNNQTESLNPFISIRFPMEADEYAVCPDTGCGGDNPDAKFSDTHSQVNITAITLNDRDAIASLSRVSAGQFALVTSNLELGSYEIEYTAVDDAGNEATFDFEFSVLERTPYELEVLPGWNLISFPGTPVDPSLGGVIPTSALVSPVLAYQDGDWLTAVVSSDGEWAGNLRQFEAGFGYWLFTTTYATLSPVIAEPELTSTPASVAVKHGWNLLGVIDVFQNPAGTPPGATVDNDAGEPVIGDAEADNYFGSIPWRIAYGYDTLRSLWLRNVPGADRAAPDDTASDEPGFRMVEGELVTQEILNGKGYWVWSAEPGTLVP